MSQPGSPPKSPSSGLRLIKSPSASARVTPLSGATLSGAHHTFESFGSRTSSIKSRSNSSSKPPSPNAEFALSASAVTGSSAVPSLHASASNLAVNSQEVRLAAASGSVASASVSGSTRTEASRKSSTSSLKSRSSSLNRRTSPKSFLSTVEEQMLRAEEPLEVTETSAITVIGNYGVWVNREEVLNWKGDLPIESYQINEDDTPEIITKRSKQNIEYVQELAIRYLRPPTPPAPGEIVITQQPNFTTGPAPPLIIRQQPPRPETPEPLVIREAPPEPPAPIGIKKITISGKQLPPPPRKVIIERLAALPPKPQAVLIERWLPYSQVKRRVIFNKPSGNDPVIVKPRNIIVQWEAPQVQIKKEYRYLGVVTANPLDYVRTYGSTLKKSAELPEFVREIPAPDGLTLAADYEPSGVHELEGDLHALKLIDLNAEGLGEYSEYVRGIASAATSRAGSVHGSRTSSIAQSFNSGSVQVGASAGVAGSRTTSVASSGVISHVSTASLAGSRTTSVASSAVKTQASAPLASRTTSIASSAVRSQASVPVASRTTSIASSVVASSGVDTASAAVESSAAVASVPFASSRTTSTASTIQPRNSVGSTVVSAVASNVSSTIQNLAASAASSRSPSAAGSFLVTASVPLGSRTSSHKSASPPASRTTSVASVVKSSSKSPVASRTTSVVSTGVKSVVSSVVQSQASVATSVPVVASRAPSVAVSVAGSRPASTVGSLASSKRKSSISSLVEQIFHTINRNHSGGISIEDAEKALLRLNSRLGRRYGEDDVIAFFSALDKNQDGTLDFEEFKSAFENIVI